MYMYIYIYICMHTYTRMYLYIHMVPVIIFLSSIWRIFQGSWSNQASNMGILMVLPFCWEPPAFNEWQSLAHPASFLPCCFWGPETMGSASNGCEPLPGTSHLSTENPQQYLLERIGSIHQGAGVRYVYIYIYTYCICV